jgi:hypothetical protein
MFFSDSNVKCWLTKEGLRRTTWSRWVYFWFAWCFILIHVQGYDLKPPSLCLRNVTTCGQGNVPIFSVEAQSAADIQVSQLMFHSDDRKSSCVSQAAVRFAGYNNLRLVVKSSGHDVLGRSTAPYSLLIRTAGLQNISMTDAFFVGTQNMGPAVTIGSGVHTQTLYQIMKANGKIVVVPTAATVCPAGGYVQGAGHSALSPLFGLAADNVLGEVCSFVSESNSLYLLLYFSLLRQSFT